jgi:hypothetical protein
MKIVLNIDRSDESMFWYAPVIEGRVCASPMTAPAGMYPCSNPDFYGFWSEYLSAPEVQKWVIDNKDLVMFLNPAGVEELCSHKFQVIQSARKAEVAREMNKYFVNAPNLGVKYLDIDGFKLYANDLRMIADLIDSKPITQEYTNPEELENLDIEFM